MRYLIVLATLLSACSVTKQCEKAAKKCAPYWSTQKPDTVLLERIVTIDSSHVDTVFDCDELPVDSTVIIKADDGRATLTLTKGKDGKVKADCNCPEEKIVLQDKLIKGPPVPVYTNEIPIWVWFLLATATGLAFVTGVKISLRHSKKT